MAPTCVSSPRLTRDGVRENLGEAREFRAGRAAHEVAQLYVHQRVAAITQPVRQLKGVRHVDLAPGEDESRSNSNCASCDLAYVQPDLFDRADPGVYDVWIAPSAAGGEKTSFSLV